MPSPISPVRVLLAHLCSTPLTSLIHADFDLEDSTTASIASGFSDEYLGMYMYFERSEASTPSDFGAVGMCSFVLCLA